MKRVIIPYNPKLKEYARNFRNNSTQAEIKLWMYVKGKQIQGFDFHRQKPIDEYILDFFCHELMLGIEVDGYTHTIEEVQKKDADKEKRMNELGIYVLRFTDEEVFMGIENVILKIEQFIEERKNNINTPLPLSRGDKQQ